MGTRLSLSYLGNRLRHDSILKLASDGLDRCGLIVRPYYIVSEGQHHLPTDRLNHDCGDFRTEFLKSQDMQVLGCIPGRHQTEADLQARLAVGMDCIALKKDDKLVAFNWVEYGQISFSQREIKLQPNEAYLFDAWTMLAFRGLKVAPMLRMQTYRLLNQTGFTNCFSVTEYLNKPATKFKHKLHAQPVELALHVALKRVAHRHFVLRQFADWRQSGKQKP